MQFRPLQREGKHAFFLMRYASKSYINNYQIHFWAINTVLMRFEEKKSINLIPKSGSPSLHAIKNQ